MYLEDEMSTKAKESKMEAVRVVMTPLGSAASNVFNMLNMSFFLVFSTEALGLNIDENFRWDHRSGHWFDHRQDRNTIR